MPRINPLQELNRKIYLNNPQQNHRLRYPTNLIKTCKYTLITFFPKSLYIQFLRLANIYFLFITVLTSFSEISPYSPVSSIIPLSFVLAASMLREALEDWSRYKNDKITNGDTANVYRKPRPKNKHKQKEEEKEEATVLMQVKWKDIVVGDLIRIENDQQIPADVVLLASSDETGVAYVETANLDGEKNLKLKQVKPEIKAMVQQAGIEHLQGAMLVDSPNQRIHHFKGIMELEGANTIYLGYNNLLLRGTYLKNTDYVIGVAVYTGHDTKLMKSQGKPKNKKSHIEINLNKYIFGIFVIQCLLCILLSVFSILFSDKYDEYYRTGQGLKLTYLFSATEAPTLSRAERAYFAQVIVNFGAFVLLLNTLIPLSLMVSLELTKFYQSKGIEYDDLIKDGNQRCKSINMQIHEDLAKVEYIFADKTGTLTTNEMKFIQCSIDGKIYSQGELSSPTQLSQRKKSEESSGEDNFNFFWLGLSLCHDVVIDKKKSELYDIRNRYQGSSPDEVELVSAAAEAGFIFKDKKAEVYSIMVQGEPKEFLFLSKIDFSSDRKRMSVIMKDLQSNKLYMFCKGADSMVLKRLKKDTSAQVLEKTKEDLKNFSKEGLRTLVISYKELEEESFTAWQNKYAEAQQLEFNIDSELDPQVKMRELEEELETDLVLLGATALEDKLQDGVADTIKDLHKAGIKIWMLTGDKLETAENIGYATSLLAKDTKVFKVHTSDVEETLERYSKIKEKIGSFKEGKHDALTSRGDLDGLEPESSSNFMSFALIIDGEAISYTFNNDKLKKVFLELIPEFRTVICCRSTPSQKANVVTFVKHNLKKMTLAIGDGGNDVNMIQQAHVGVGIFGKEGNQAAFASDYAICQFYFLWRLLLVHGRWSYLRTANFITFFIYKNIIFTLPQFWFALNSGFSGQTFYSDLYLSNYNTIFTSVAPVYYALQEQDVNPRENETIRKAMPHLFAEFREKNLFSFSKFLFWWLIGIIHSIMIFYMTQAGTDGIVDSSGDVFEFWRESMTALSATFYTVFALIIIGSNHYQVMTLLSYGLLTFVIYFPGGSVIFDQFDSPIYHAIQNMLETPKAWLTMFLVVGSCSLILYIPKMYYSLFSPSLVDLLQRDRMKQPIGKEAVIWKSPGQNLQVVDSKHFDFNAKIMMEGWYIPKIEMSPGMSYIVEKEASS